jgi:hypothetical protein
MIIYYNITRKSKRSDFMGKEKPLKHLVTYKPSEKHLYDFVEKQRCKSNFIKDLIERYIQEKEEKEDVPHR